MKTKTNILTLIASVVVMGVVLSSCCVSKNDNFAARKYTKFKKGYAKTFSEITKAGENTITEKPIINEIADASNDNNFAISTLESPIKIATEKREAKAFSIKANNKIEKKQEKLNRIVNLINKKLAKKSKNSIAPAGNTDEVLLIILCILLPPLAVFLYSGIGNEFWIDLILTCLFWIPGVIYALLVVLDAI